MTFIKLKYSNTKYLKPKKTKNLGLFHLKVQNSSVPHADANPLAIRE